jgi:hypothetical protein
MTPPPPAQLAAGVYSARAARGLLRLYHFFPERRSAPAVELLFLHALMALPDADFVQHLSLLPDAARSPAILLLAELEQLLQKAHFADFWARAASPLLADLLARAKLGAAFPDAARAFAAAVLLRAYRRISLAELAASVGLGEAAAREWVAKRGWALGADGLVELPASADNTARPVKRVGEDGLGLKFSEVSAVLGHSVK